MKLNYSIDENDIESQRALQQAEADAPKANVVAAMQSTLARVLQSQTPPQPDGQSDPAATAKSVGNQWGAAN